MADPGPVVFWNVERLFAAGGSAIHAALSGGAPPRLGAAEVDAKVAVLGAVLAALAEQQGKPALLGLAEVETAALVEQVAAASGLGLASVEGVVADELGFELDALDIGLLYDPDRFGPPTRLHSHIIDRTFDTRDILEVHLPELATGRSVCVLVNHWPSRLSLESADRRAGAAYYVSQIVADVVRFRASELWDPAARRLRVPPKRELERRAREPVVLMGDFNDEPFDTSFDVLRATPERDEVAGDLDVSGRGVVERYTSYAASLPRLFNPTWEVCTGQLGTFYRSPRWRVYDQVLLSSGALEPWGGLRAAPFRPATVTRGGATVSLQTPSGKPRGFDAQSGKGASDHFPIVLGGAG
jgi:hypothetical protein